MNWCGDYTQEDIPNLLNQINCNLYNIAARLQMTNFSVCEAGEKQKPISNGWISVKDRLPKSSEAVIVYVCDYSHKNTYVAVGYVEPFAQQWCNLNGEKYEGWLAVTHWQPFPEPPKSEENE